MFVLLIIQMNAIEPNLPLIPFVMLYKVPLMLPGVVSPLEQVPFVCVSADSGVVSDFDADS